jgi:hypothetical protein
LYFLLCISADQMGFLKEPGHGRDAHATEDRIRE